MAPRKKGGARNSKKTIENNNKKARLDTYLKDLNSQFENFMKLLDSELEVAVTQITNNYRQCELKIPKDARNSKWIKFLTVNIEERAESSGISNSTQPDQENMDTAASYNATLEESVFDLPPSPERETMPPPKITQLRAQAKTAKKVNTASASMKTPAAQTINPFTGPSLITPKLPIGQTPLSRCRNPRNNEILYSSRGSPVSTIKKSRLPKNAVEPTGITLKTADNSTVTLSAVDDTHNEPLVEVDEVHLGLLKQLQNKLNRIVNFNQQR